MLGTMTKTGAKKPKDPRLMEIGLRVQKALEEKGMSATQFRKAASALDPKDYEAVWHSSTTSNITSGNREPTPGQYKTIAHLLGVSTDWLMTGKGQNAAAAPTPTQSPSTQTVVEAIEDYIRRRGRGLTEEETELVRGWFKVKAPPVLTDELIEGFLRLWREHNERVAKRVAERAGVRGIGSPTGQDHN